MSIDLRLTEAQRTRLDELRRTDAGLLPALVVREHREALVVLLPEGGERRARTGGRLRHEAAGPADLPAVGDRVGVEVPPGGGEAVVRAVLPRRTALLRKRPDRSVAAQVLAANVDLVLLTASLHRPLSPRRLERALALAWDGGADPVILLTKADLHPDPEAAVREISAGCPGAPVLAVSASTGSGMEGLLGRLLPGVTTALLGPSGDGKSTLANRLLGGAVLETGEVREVDGRGRHTTVDRHLVVLPGGGFLVDTPGLREIGLFDAGEGIASVFAEISEAAGPCRFRDCLHSGEPGCAVEAAVGEGAVDPGRLESWRRLRREEAFLERKAGVHAMREEKRNRRAHGRMVEDALEWKRRLRAGGIKYPVQAISLVPPARRPWVEADPALRHLFECLEAGPRNPPTLTEAAKASVLGGRTIERRFREVVGRPYRDFIKEWRLGNAWMILCEGTLTPQETMAAVGRGSKSSFSRDFLDRFTTTPKEVYDVARGRKQGRQGRREKTFPQLRLGRPRHNLLYGKQLDG